MTKLLSSYLIHIDTHQDVLMIDLHYFVIETCLAINTDINFESLFTRRIIEFAEEYNVTLQNVFLVEDCKRDDIWRKSYYSKYKENRKKFKSHGISQEIFDYIYDIYLPWFRNTFGVKIIGHAKCEAEDVIAIIKKKISKRLIIVTNDRDFLQLSDNNTIIVNIHNEDLKNLLDHTIISLIDENNEFSSLKFILAKIFKGDRSDNIPPIEYNRSIIQKLIDDDMFRVDYLLNDTEKLLQFRLNRFLISFKYIPNNIITEIESRLIMIE